MVRKTFLSVFVLTIALSVATAFAGSNLTPGKWEITTETEMVGMPMKPPPVTHTQCLMKEDLVPQSAEANDVCKVSDISISGDTVCWKIVCSGENGGMEGTGKATYGGDTMTGTMELVMYGSGIKVINKLSGHRIGACD